MSPAGQGAIYKKPISKTVRVSNADDMQVDRLCTRGSLEVSVIEISNLNYTFLFLKVTILF